MSGLGLLLLLQLWLWDEVVTLIWVFYSWENQSKFSCSFSQQLSHKSWRTVSQILKSASATFSAFEFLMSLSWVKLVEINKVWIKCWMWIEKIQNLGTESTFICATKQMTSFLISSYINAKLLFQCFDLDSMNDTSYVVRKRQQFAYLCGEESRRCLEKVKSHGKVFSHSLTDTLASECHFFPQS